MPNASNGDITKPSCAALMAAAVMYVAYIETTMQTRVVTLTITIIIIVGLPPNFLYKKLPKSTAIIAAIEDINPNYVDTNA